MSLVQESSTIMSNENENENDLINQSFESFMQNEQRFELIKSDLVSMNLVIETFTERYNDVGYKLENNKNVLLNEYSKKLSCLITMDKSHMCINFTKEIKELINVLELSDLEIKWFCDLITSINAKMETLSTITWNDSIMCQYCNLVIGSPLSPCGHHICHTCYNIVPTKQVKGEHCQRAFYKLNYGKFCPVCYEPSELPTFLYVEGGQVTHQGVNMIPSLNPFNFDE